jgi:hypothetical protein
MSRRRREAQGGAVAERRVERGIDLLVTGEVDFASQRHDDRPVRSVLTGHGAAFPFTVAACLTTHHQPVTADANEAVAERRTQSDPYR